MADTLTVRLARDIDAADISMGSLKALDNGGKMVWAAYRGGERLVVQLPCMKAPFGLSLWTDDKTHAKKYTLDLSFDGMDTDKRLAGAYALFKAIDARLVQEALANSEAWFKKRHTNLEVLEALYSPIVRQPKDDRFAPTIKLPLATDAKGAFRCSVYDAGQERIELLDAATKGAQVTAIVQMTGVWIAGGKFGASWKVQQLRVVPPPRLSGYAFGDEAEA